MTQQLHDTGEEYIIDRSFRSDQTTADTELEVSLYDDSTDSLSDSSDVGNISTEPSGSAFARQTVNTGAHTTPEITVSDASGDWQANIPDVTFDTSDSSQSVDSYFIVVTYTSDDTSDTSDTDHLMWTGALDQSYDLSSVDSFTLSGAGLSLT